MNPMRFTIRPAKGGYRVLIQDATKDATVLRSDVIRDFRDAKFAFEFVKAYGATAFLKVERRHSRAA